MVLATFITRLSDGLMLVSSYTQTDELQRYTDDAKRLTRELNHDSPRRCTIEAEKYSFHYSIASNTLFLTLTVKSYPRKLAYIYLDEVSNRFMDYVQRISGPQWASILASLDRPYYYIQFDKTLQQVRREFADPTSRESTTRLNNDLQDIQSIMKKNISDILVRGENLDAIADTSRTLAESSKEFKWKAKKMNMLALYRKWAPLLVGALLVLFFLFVRFYWL